MNRVELIGRWTKDIELRYTGSGVAVAVATLAVDRPFKTEGQPEADFIRIVMFKKTAEKTAEYTGKGHLVGVEGRLQVRNYEAQDGSKRQVVEVVADRVQFLSKPGNGNGKQGNQDDDPFAGLGEPIDFNENDLPF